MRRMRNFFRRIRGLFRRQRPASQPAPNQHGEPPEDIHSESSSATLAASPRLSILDLSDLPNFPQYLSGAPSLTADEILQGRQDRTIQSGPSSGAGTSIPVNPIAGPNLPIPDLPPVSNLSPNLSSSPISSGTTAVESVRELQDQTTQSTPEDGARSSIPPAPAAGPSQVSEESSDVPTTPEPPPAYRGGLQATWQRRPLSQASDFAPPPPVTSSLAVDQAVGETQPRRTQSLPTTPGPPPGYGAESNSTQTQTRTSQIFSSEPLNSNRSDLTIQTVLQGTQGQTTQSTQAGDERSLVPTAPTAGPSQAPQERSEAATTQTLPASNTGTQTQNQTYGPEHLHWRLGRFPDWMLTRFPTTQRLPMTREGPDTPGPSQAATTQALPASDAGTQTERQPTSDAGTQTERLSVSDAGTQTENQNHGPQRLNRRPGRIFERFPMESGTTRYQSRFMGGNLDPSQGPTSSDQGPTSSSQGPTSSDQRPISPSQGPTSLNPGLTSSNQRSTSTSLRPMSSDPVVASSSTSQTPTNSEPVVASSSTSQRPTSSEPVVASSSTSQRPTSSDVSHGPVNSDSPGLTSFTSSEQRIVDRRSLERRVQREGRLGSEDQRPGSVDQRLGSVDERPYLHGAQQGPSGWTGQYLQRVTLNTQGAGQSTSTQGTGQNTQGTGQNTQGTGQNTQGTGQPGPAGPGSWRYSRGGTLSFGPATGQNIPATGQNTQGTGQITQGTGQAAGRQGRWRRHLGKWSQRLRRWTRHGERD